MKTLSRIVLETTFMLETFAKRNIIILSGTAFLALMYAFQWIHAGVGDGPLLDRLLTVSDARQRLAEMTSDQIRIHLIGTATIDMVYPFAYAIFFSGLLYRLGGTWQKTLVFLPLIGACFDLVENLIQVAVLVNFMDLLSLKPFVTWPKFALAFISIALILLLGFIRLCQSVIKHTSSRLH